MTYKRWKEGFEKSTVRAIWLWKRKTHYTESGKANLRAKDSSKLGYSCLSTNRCLSSKCHSKHHLPLKQMGGYKGGRAGQPHRGKNTAGGVLLHIPHFATLIKKKKKKIPPLCTFSDRRLLTLPGSGCQNNCSRPQHPTFKCLVCLPNPKGVRNYQELWEGPRQITLSFSRCWGFHRPRKGYSVILLQPAAGTKPRWGRSAKGFYFQLLLPELPQFEFWTNNRHGNHYLQ